MRRTSIMSFISQESATISKSRYTLPFCSGIIMVGLYASIDSSAAVLPDVRTISASLSASMKVLFLSDNLTLLSNRGEYISMCSGCGRNITL